MFFKFLSEPIKAREGKTSVSDSTTYGRFWDPAVWEQNRINDNQSYGTSSLMKGPKLDTKK